LFLSGGIHEEYKMEKLNKNNNINESDPNMDELLEIIKIAIMKKDIVGCILEDVILFVYDLIFHFSISNQ
jgi:hypothetical protein